MPAMESPHPPWARMLKNPFGRKKGTPKQNDAADAGNDVRVSVEPSDAQDEAAALKVSSRGTASTVADGDADAVANVSSRISSGDVVRPRARSTAELVRARFQAGRDEEVASTDRDDEATGFLPREQFDGAKECPTMDDGSRTGSIVATHEHVNLVPLRVLLVLSGTFFLVGFSCLIMALKEWLFPGGSSVSSSRAVRLPAGAPRIDGGFCCWRSHPVPHYGGSACDCPMEHRGYYECPPDNCTDSSGYRWQRGSLAPWTNAKGFCKQQGDWEASWCPMSVQKVGLELSGPEKVPEVQTDARHSPGGFCCWRDHPLPFYFGDPCLCPEQHRGDYECPPGGCRDESLAVWKRGSEAVAANSHSVCTSKQGIAAWCSASSAKQSHERLPVSSLQPQASQEAHHSPVAALPVVHQIDWPEDKGFCCWRDHPRPFYAGDPCDCPLEHRGYFNCPPQGCSDGTGSVWKRGSAFPMANKKLFCFDPRFARIAGWCHGRESPTPIPRPLPVVHLEPVTTQAPVHQITGQEDSGFCCWRDHPRPFYLGDPCDCPMEHRGYFNCPVQGCTDGSGVHWKRGLGFPLANEKQFCLDLRFSHIAAWCEPSSRAEGIKARTPLLPSTSESPPMSLQTPSPTSLAPPATTTSASTVTTAALSESETTAPVPHDEQSASPLVTGPNESNSTAAAMAESMGFAAPETATNASADPCTVMSAALENGSLGSNATVGNASLESNASGQGNRSAKQSSDELAVTNHSGQTGNHTSSSSNRSSESANNTLQSKHATSNVSTPSSNSSGHTTKSTGHAPKPASRKSMHASNPASRNNSTNHTTNITSISAEHAATSSRHHGSNTTLSSRQQHDASNSSAHHASNRTAAHSAQDHAAAKRSSAAPRPSTNHSANKPPHAAKHNSSANKPPARSAPTSNRTTFSSTKGQNQSTLHGNATVTVTTQHPPAHPNKTDPHRNTPATHHSASTATHVGTTATNSHTTTTRPPATTSKLPLKSPSLFCWAVAQASGNELALLKDHFQHNDHIFACDAFLVFTDVEVTLAPGVKTVAIGSFDSRRTPWKTWYNVPVFARAWQALVQDGRWKTYEWTVKVDLDAFMRPGVLRTKLDFHHATPAEACVWNNYDTSKLGIARNFLGPLEVFSRKAVEIFALRGQKECPVPASQVAGEDAWIHFCMLHLGVHPRNDFNFLKDCPGCLQTTPTQCASCDFIAYHPFKDVQAYRECAEIASRIHCD
eukprot:gb/GFBE01042492.1/.p1 GENE.gb/GFBE01042492.1/~~gb/GFBE01042492.1/.p1  ORF type:complete len:1231 (+),score=164.15 gb/GFBE01042492.1/:1-3693(+)